MKELYLKKLMTTEGMWVASTSIGKIAVTDDMVIKLDSTEMSYISQNSEIRAETNNTVLKNMKALAKESEEAKTTVIKYTWEYDIYTSESCAVAVKIRYIKMFGVGVNYRITKDGRYVLVLEDNKPLGWIKSKPFSSKALEDIFDIAKKLHVEPVIELPVDDVVVEQIPLVD